MLSYKVASDSYIIGESIRLKGPYDPDQHWFDFMHGVRIAATVKKKDPTPYSNYSDDYRAQLSRRDYEAKLHRPTIRRPKHLLCPSAFRQYVLPFREGRVINDQEFRRMREETEWGGLRVDDAGPVHVVISGRKIKLGPTKANCERMIEGRFHLHRTQEKGGKTHFHGYFETEDDAALFALCVVYE